MICPFCKSANTKVYNNDRRYTTHPNKFIRYCKCLDCDKKFKTTETYFKDYNAPKAFIKTRRAE